MAWKDLSKDTRIGIVAGGAVLISMITGVSLVGEAARQSANSNDTSVKQEISGSSENKAPIKKPKNETKKVQVFKATAYNTVRKDDSNLAKGKTKVMVAGKNGEKVITYKVTYVDGKEISRKKVSEKVTRKSITKVVSVGTYVKKISNCDPNYGGYCVPKVGYDLDCRDIGYSVVSVKGYDIHGFDGDGDGYGCNGYY